MPRDTRTTDEALAALQVEVRSVLDALRRNKLRRYKVDREAHDGFVSIRGDVLALLTKQRFDYKLPIGSAGWQEVCEWALCPTHTRKTIKLPVDFVDALLGNPPGLRVAVMKHRQAGKPVSFMEISAVYAPHVHIDIPMGSGNAVGVPRSALDRLKRDVLSGALICVGWTVDRDTDTGKTTKHYAMYARAEEGNVLTLDKYAQHHILLDAIDNKFNRDRAVGLQQYACVPSGKRVVSFETYGIEALFDVRNVGTDKQPRTDFLLLDRVIG